MMVLPSQAAKEGQEVRFYVSPSGRDCWSGKLDVPNTERTDGPFATIEQARQAIRDLKAGGGLTGPVRVLLREGVYELNEPLTFTPADSGTSACPITYSAFPGEKPILSGGRQITGWRAGEINGKSCLAAELPEVSDGMWYFTQLFVNNERRDTSRLPESGYFRFAAMPEARKVPDFHKGPEYAEFVPGDLAAWRNMDDVEIVVLQAWFDKHLKIAEVDEKKHVVKFVTPGGSLRDEKVLPARYYVKNVAEAVNRSGQWYLDRPTGRLCYLPREGETAKNLQAVAPRLERLVVFQGEDSQLVEHIRMERLAIRHAEFRYPPGNTGANQAAHDIPGAVLFDKSTGCALYACEISAVGGYGAEMNGQADRLIACRIGDLGAGGVKIGGNKNIVSDCYIYDGGAIYHQGVGILVFNCNGTRIRHNEVCRFDYTGVSCGWMWGYTDTGAGDNRIEYNHIYGIGRGVLSDMGGIYTLGVQPGTVLRGNVIHDVSRYGYGGWGIYLDEGSSDMLNEDNIIYRAEDGSWNQHYGRDNLIINNIFALGGNPQIFCSDREPHHGHTLSGNIFFWKTSRCIQALQSRVLFKNNLYWRSDRMQEHVDGAGPLWDQDGMVADPLFNDPDNGDFSFKDGSPAPAWGFRPISTKHVGPRYDEHRPLPDTLDDWPGDNEEPMKFVRTRLELINQPAEDGTGGLLKATAENLGSVTVKGQLRLHSRIGQVIDDEGMDVLQIDLQPNQSVSKTFTFTGDRESELAISAQSNTIDIRPTCLYVVPSCWIVSQMGDLSLKDVPSALAGVSRRVVNFCGVPIGEMRICLAGDKLAVHAKIIDQDVGAVTSKWEDRGLDLMAFMPDQQEWTRRVKLHPTSWDSVECLTMKDGQVEQTNPPGVCSAIKPIQVGYELTALVPLSLLTVEESAKEFRFDACFRLSIEPGIKPKLAPLFDCDIYNPKNTKGFGTIVVR